MTQVKREMPGALLARLDACEDARKWVGKSRSFRKLWDSCERGDWLLWLAAKLDVNRKLIVTAACQCARLALKHVPAGETRPLKAIETAEAWVRGDATIEQVRAAADAAADAAAYAAYAAYAAADAAAAYAAAAAAAHAAHAAAAAYAYAAYAAAAYAAADYAAADAARADARAKAMKECAALVRETIPFASLGLEDSR
jgi:hypothetical protein